MSMAIDRCDIGINNLRFINLGCYETHMKSSQDSRNILNIPAANIAIIQSSWHREYSDKMFNKCKSVLARHGANTPLVHLLPGALELPYAAQFIVDSDSSIEAIIAFGIIIKGETDHYQMVRDACLHGLLRVSLDCKIPIINEVLAVYTAEDAEKRCADDNFNKGLEAAYAAIEIIHWQRRLLSNET